VKGASLGSTPSYSGGGSGAQAGAYTSMVSLRVGGHVHSIARRPIGMDIPRTVTSISPSRRASPESTISRCFLDERVGDSRQPF
jgi:hypothetical protein